MAQSPTREKYPLSKKKIIKKSIGSITSWTIFSIILATIVGFITESAGTGFLVFFLVEIPPLAVFVFYQYWYFMVYYYDLTDTYTVIKKGPITPREITIPYERVQDVYMDQDILDRIFGLYDVHLSSATIASGMEAHIDGLEREAADGLKNTLLQIVTDKIQRASANYEKQPQTQGTNQTPQPPEPTNPAPSNPYYSLGPESNT